MSRENRRENPILGDASEQKQQLPSYQFNQNDKKITGTIEAIRALYFAKLPDNEQFKRTGNILVHNPPPNIESIKNEDEKELAENIAKDREEKLANLDARIKSSARREGLITNEGGFERLNQLIQFVEQNLKEGFQQSIIGEGDPNSKSFKTILAEKTQEINNQVTQLEQVNKALTQSLTTKPINPAAVEQHRDTINRIIGNLDNTREDLTHELHERRERKELPIQDLEENGLTNLIRTIITAERSVKPIMAQTDEVTKSDAVETEQKNAMATLRDTLLQLDVKVNSALQADKIDFKEMDRTVALINKIMGVLGDNKAENTDELFATIKVTLESYQKIRGETTKLLAGEEEKIIEDAEIDPSLVELLRDLDEPKDNASLESGVAKSETEVLLDQLTSMANDVDTELKQASEPTPPPQAPPISATVVAGTPAQPHEPPLTPAALATLSPTEASELEHHRLRIIELKNQSIYSGNRRQFNLPYEISQREIRIKELEAKAAAASPVDLTKGKEEAPKDESRQGLSQADELELRLAGLRKDMSELESKIKKGSFEPGQKEGAISELIAMKDIESKLKAQADEARESEAVQQTQLQGSSTAAHEGGIIEQPIPTPAAAPTSEGSHAALAAAGAAEEAKEQIRIDSQGLGGSQHFAEFRKVVNEHRQSVKDEAKAFLREKFPNRQTPGETGEKPLGLFDKIKYGYNIAKMNLPAAKFRAFNEVSVPEETKTLERQNLQSSTFLGYIRNLPNMVRNGFSTFAVTIGMGVGAVVSGFSNQEAQNAKNQVEAKMDASLHELNRIADDFDKLSSASQSQYGNETIKGFDKILKGAFERIQKDRAALVSNGLGTLNEVYGKNAPEVVINAINAVGADLGKPEISDILSKKIADANNITIEPRVQKMDAEVKAMEGVSPLETMQAGQQESTASDKIQKLRAEISELQKQLPAQDNIQKVSLQWQISVRQTEINQLQASATQPAATSESAVVKAAAPNILLDRVSHLEKKPNLTVETVTTAKDQNKPWSIEMATDSASKGELSPGLTALMRITKTLHDFDENVMQVSLLVVPGRETVSETKTKGILRDDLSTLMTSPEYTNLSRGLKLKIERLSDVCEQAEKSAKTTGKDKAFLALRQEISAAKKPNGLLSALNDEIKMAVERANKSAAAAAPVTPEPVITEAAAPVTPEPVITEAAAAVTAAPPEAASAAAAPEVSGVSAVEEKNAAEPVMAELSAEEISAQLAELDRIYENPKEEQKAPEIEDFEDPFAALDRVIEEKQNTIPMIDVEKITSEADTYIEQLMEEYAAEKSEAKAEVDGDTLEPGPEEKEAFINQIMNEYQATAKQEKAPVGKETKDQVKLKVDKGPQLSSVTEKLGEAGITPIQTDWPMKREHATISFNSTEKNADQVAGKLAEVEPPLKPERIIKANDSFRQKFKQASEAMSESKDKQFDSEETIQPRSPGGSSHE